MARKTDLWIGKNDDTIPPPRIRLRTFEKNGGRCHLCNRQIRAGEYWQCDHVIALVNGGKNSEENLRPACRNCCYEKTAQDIAEKSAIAEKRKKHLLPKGPSKFRKPPGFKFSWRTGRMEKTDA